MAKITGSAARFTQEFIDKGYWEPRLTADYWDSNAVKFPDREALVDAESRLTWMQVKKCSDRLALKFLELGIKRDEVVVSQLPNINDFILVRLALLKAGILACQPAMTLREKEMEHILGRTEAVAAVVPWKFRKYDYFEMIKRLQPRLARLQHIIVSGQASPEGVLSLQNIYEQALEEKYPAGHLATTRYDFSEFTHIAATSGTTGVPKLVNQSDAAIKLSAKDTIERVGMTGDDVIAIFAPASGGAANVLSFYCAPICGAKVVLSETFEPEELLKLIEAERPSMACSVPTILVRLLNYPELHKFDVSSLKVVFYYGAPIAYQTAMEVEEKLGCKVISRYGAFDIATVSCTSVNDRRETRLLTAGKPYTGCEIRLYPEDGAAAMAGQEGEIWMKGPTCTHGFYRDAEGTDLVWNVPGKEGWGCTGDNGRFDADGNLVMVGRKKGVIIRGGQNIYPREVEDILRTHEKVADVAIVGMPDPVMGERVCAFIAPRTGQSVLLEEVVSFFKEKLVATFKIPERVELVDKLPLVSGQKVDYRRLAEELERRLKG
ncbi:MAG: class I adenylate-forming enzyme family protein [Desulfobacterales bacterium]|nr:class I adenylate-forming enzyme family protein [Desulfobacterales bacterium]